jgi:YegS/Rv2252/BmrU family lipid kinase
MKKMLFIMNPKAGQRKANKYLAEILTIFNRAGYLVEVFMTAGPGDGAQMARSKGREVDLIVCCGGDGTFNEAVSGTLSEGIHVPVGYIPAGTTNDFASSLKLPTSPVAAARAIAEGKPIAYDAGRFCQRYFTYVASFGAFTKASYATPQSFKNALGHLAYVLEGIQELSQIKKEHIRIELDDGTVVEDDFLFGAISNTMSVGGVFTLDPKQVNLRDGLFEIFLIRAPRDITEISECLQALTTKKYNCQMITFLTAKQMTVYAREDMSWTLDGEYFPGASEVRVENLMQSVQLMRKE